MLLIYGFNIRIFVYTLIFIKFHTELNVAFMIAFN